MVGWSHTRQVPQLPQRALSRSRLATSCERAIFRYGAYRTDVAVVHKMYRRYLEPGGEFAATCRTEQGRQSLTRVSPFRGIKRRFDRLALTSATRAHQRHR